MRVYLAAPWELKQEVQRHAQTMTDEGFHVTSTWHAEAPSRAYAALKPWDKRACAERDLAQIQDSDALLVFTTGSRTTGGHLVELGYALGRGMPVAVVGHGRDLPYDIEWPNVFCFLDPVRRCVDLGHAMGQLRLVVSA